MGDKHTDRMLDLGVVSKTIDEEDYYSDHGEPVGIARADQRKAQAISDIKESDDFIAVTFKLENGQICANFITCVGFIGVPASVELAAAINDLEKQYDHVLEGETASGIVPNDD